jgi:hypothetical protein
METEFGASKGGLDLSGKDYRQPRLSADSIMNALA